MIPPSMELVERLLREDVPSLDLTTQLLELPQVPARLTLTTRTPVTVAGAAIAQALCAYVGAEVERLAPSGSDAPAGSVLLSACATPAALHRVWKVVVNVYESACGIATRTRALVTAAKVGSPRVEVFTTRKVIPGTKDLAVSAILAGGALPHRLGLSETVLIFDQHTIFIGGVAGLARRLEMIRHRAVEKVVFAEVSTFGDAVVLAEAGVGGLQFDKVPVAELGPMVSSLRNEYPNIRLIAAGGISPNNAADYAATGVDAIASSWMYSGPVADVSARIVPTESI
jgi:molybdenum transport protein